MNFSYLSELAFNFVKELNIPVTKTSIKLEFEKHPQQQWCAPAKISFSATVFINGYKLPDPYHLEDIKYLI